MRERRLRLRHFGRLAGFVVPALAFGCGHSRTPARLARRGARGRLAGIDPFDVTVRIARPRHEPLRLEIRSRDRRLVSRPAIYARPREAS